MKPLTLVCLVLFIFRLQSAVAATVTGIVFDDRNGDGVRQSDEPGIASVAISNGKDVVLTDTEGHYTITGNVDDWILLIKPRGWQPAPNAQQLPQSYRRVSKASASDMAMDFPLHKYEDMDTFKMVAFTDTQPESEKEVGYLQRTIIPGLAKQKDLAFGVTLGDVAFDRPDLYGPLNEAVAQIGIPWYPINGNHDLNLDARDDRHSVTSFENVYGPTTFAFHYGKVLFVGLNNVRFPLAGGNRFSFAGGLRDDQFVFLENLLRVTPRDKLIVLMMHIPLFAEKVAGPAIFREADRLRLFQLLKDRPHTFSLSGHTHYQRHVFFGAADGWLGTEPHHHYNVAAADGSFWSGPPDASGVPVATMWDGTPHGYAIITFKGTAYEIDYRAARFGPEHQIGLHAPVSIPAKKGFISIYANVFNGHDGWTVEARVDERPWAPMRRVLEWDPNYAKLYLDQDAASTPLPGPRLPDPTICFHLWKSYLPGDLTAGIHRVEVRAVDPYRKTFTAFESVKVVE